MASLVSANAPTRLWCRRPEVAGEINARATNEQYLPGFALAPSLEADCDLAAAVTGAGIVAMAVPSHVFRGVLEELVPHLEPGVPVISLSKGLEQGSHRRMSEIVEELAPGHPVGVLTGPNLAREVLAGSPAAAVLAMNDVAAAERLVPTFAREHFRVYVGHDVVGCELGGALKNVVALAVGMAEGLGLADNSRAALITRGLAELTRLGVAMGGEPATFAGLAGLGDLLATCLSPQSRNHHVGVQLGRGRTLGEITAAMQQVAEGVKTARVVLELAAEHGLEMPITSELCAVLDGGRDPALAYRNLLGRSLRPEPEPLG
ncbi:MAG: NAD(P)-dependent glycerol-3-phosphate dehydrogenase [Acidimicrobiia bacterium]|nr:NAD(P)-dependent glycerol-3-phosphate dehydrogenase [Acidimicrobiia bacterium]MYC46141.1 NAD(P)-dependent glycerol-3-phosphate dehydrogenase [Acidimicrobiia bacterium]MYI20216.1 NAD(P)-dependent glycerol-3-phosphate dehydrogenase [Acidimicrobiia bacterium]